MNFNAIFLEVNERSEDAFIGRDYFFAVFFFQEKT